MTEVLPVKPAIQGEPPLAKSGDPVADPHLSVAASARALRISPATLRRYIRDYREHLDVVRNGRRLMVAVSSIPSLAQIRDLRARKFSREDIDRILAELPGSAALAGRAAVIEMNTSDAVNSAVEEALSGIRTELTSLRQAQRDNDTVMRQSLANILFLIDKFGKELQFHASEERIANIERDLRLTYRDMDAERQPPAPIRKKSWIARAGAMFRRRAAKAA